MDEENNEDDLLTAFGAPNAPELEDESEDISFEDDEEPEGFI